MLVTEAEVVNKEARSWEEEDDCVDNSLEDSTDDLVEDSVKDTKEDPVDGAAEVDWREEDSVDDDSASSADDTRVDVGSIREDKVLNDRGVDDSISEDEETEDTMFVWVDKVDSGAEDENKVEEGK